SGLALARGLVLATYFELTPEARADAERGQRWLWTATLALWAATAVAAWRWRLAPWPLLAVATAGPVALFVESLGWIPPLALVVSVPLLLIGSTGILLSPTRR
ncbi:MAG: hypothetical protein ACRDO4_12715, partial [Nocardioides sp.]